MGLEGLAAVVTGGGGGIGRAVADQLLRAGARVAIVARGRERLLNAQASLAPIGEVIACPCDVTDAEAVARLMADVREAFGQIDILVCSHGVITAGFDFLDFPVARWRETIDINLVGTFICGQAAARVMSSLGRRGRIINISSITAFGSVPRLSAYNTSKGAVEALTRSMAVDLAVHRITVNAIAPGRVRTAMVETLPSSSPTINPIGRAAEPEEIARAVVWLADPATSFVTGSTLVMDGGRRALL